MVITNRPVERRLEPRRAGDPACLVSNNARIMQTLPWRPRFADLDTIVRHALAWEERLSVIRSEAARAA